MGLVSFFVQNCVPYGSPLGASCQNSPFLGARQCSPVPNISSKAAGQNAALSIADSFKGSDDLQTAQKLEGRSLSNLHPSITVILTHRAFSGHTGWLFPPRFVGDGYRGPTSPISHLRNSPPSLQGFPRTSRKRRPKNPRQRKNWTKHPTPEPCTTSEQSRAASSKALKPMARSGAALKSAQEFHNRQLRTPATFLGSSSIVRTVHELAKQRNRHPLFRRHRPYSQTILKKDPKRLRRG